MEAYNNISCPKCSWQGDAYVSFYMKGGKIAINSIARKMMGINPGDMVEFYRKEIDGVDEWYVSPVKENGFKLSKHAGSNTLIFTRKELVTAVFNSIFYEGDVARVSLLRKRRVEDKWVYKLDISKIKNQ